MKFVHFDIFAGISGDMILGALVDCGLETTRLETELKRMQVPGFKLTSRKVPRGEMSGTKIDLELPEEHAHRGLRDIERLIRDALYSDWVTTHALAIFRRIAEAESLIHQMPVETIHFHEIGAMDSILDVTGSVLALELLGVPHVTSTSVPLGRGTVDVAHGTMPVPAPATLELLRGVPCRPGLNDGEVTTPTGAAFIAVMAQQFGELPPSRPAAIGYGAGTRGGGRVPNLLRAVVAESDETTLGEVVALEANLDDMRPQFYGYLMERLFGAGALDVYLTPIYMKKNRPGTQVTVLGRAHDVGMLRDIVLSETPSLGLRLTRMTRYELPRDIIEVETRFGRLRVKRSGAKLAPEFEDCAEAARRHAAPIQEVFEEALRVAREKQ